MQQKGFIMMRYAVASKTVNVQATCLQST